MEYDIKARFILFGPPKLLAQTLLELKMNNKNLVTRVDLTRLLFVVMTWVMTATIFDK